MPTFDVFSCTLTPSAPLRKRRSRPVQRLIAVLRYIQAVGIAGLSFGVTLVFVHTQLVFVLLPVGVFVATRVILGRTNLRHLMALLLTVCVTVLYFGFVTWWELLTHDAATPEIIVVTTTLALAVMIEPVREIAQTGVEQRFHLHDDATAAAVETFIATLREEIDRDQVREHFLDVVQHIMRPQFVSVWLCVTVDASPEASPALLALPDRTGAQPLWSGPSAATTDVVIDDADPLIVSLLRKPAAVELAGVHLDSPFVSDLIAHAVEVVVPLVGQGKLLGLLTLGPRLNGHEYGRDDCKLLDRLVAQVVPALRVAQLVRMHESQVRERERIEQELRTARAIQHTFLPKEMPPLPGWQLVPYFQPAREVGGDFYDVLTFEDGQVGLVIGDVADKGVPAALLMTATRTMLRTAAQATASPRDVFARVNDLLCADIPSGMFVTCFYALLDPSSGKLRYANAGHEVPYRCRNGCVTELWVTGVPLGMLPGTRYDEYETDLVPGESLLFYSDGVVEAHSPDHEMFGFPRLKALLEGSACKTPNDVPGESSLTTSLLAALQHFTGDAWEQEDDVTLLLLQRLPALLAEAPQPIGAAVASAE